MGSLRAQGWNCSFDIGLDMNQKFIIVGAPITALGGTIRRLRLWLGNVPEGSQVAFLYFSNNSERSLFPEAARLSNVRLVYSALMGRWGRVLVLPATMAVIREILRYRASVLVSFFPWTMFAAGIATRIAGKIGLKIRHVIYLAGDPVPPEAGPWARRIYRLLFRMTLRMCDEVVVLSKGMADDLRRDYGLLHKLQVRVVPISIEGANLTAESNLRVRQPSEVVFGAVARLQPGKGFDVGLRALAIVTKQVAARLVIYGTGPDAGHLHDLACELGISEYVEFRGWIADPLEAYRLMDCVLLPSISEGTPRSLLEAASVGVPMIASSVGGIPDLIEHENTGWLVPPGDVQALALVMLDIIRRRDILVVVGSRAREMVKARPTPSEEIQAVFGYQ